MIRLGAPRYHYDSLNSTMNLLNELAASGASEGTLVVADEQWAGRGRAGRVWSSRPGTALLCSLLLRPQLPPHELGPLPLIAGLATAEAIETLAPVQTRLKWPNDVFIGNRKVCGVLMQARAAGDRTGFVNLGIGLNVSSSIDELPDGATSIHAEVKSTRVNEDGDPQAPHPVAVGGDHSSSRGQRMTEGAEVIRSEADVSVSEVEAAVMDRLTWHYDQFQSGQNHEWIAAWLSRALYLGETVRIEQAGADVVGVFTGVSSQGALILRTGDGEREIVSGDLTRGPRPLPVR